MWWYVQMRNSFRVLHHFHNSNFDLRPMSVLSVYQWRLDVNMRHTKIWKSRVDALCKGKNHHKRKQVLYREFCVVSFITYSFQRLEVSIQGFFFLWLWKGSFFRVSLHTQWNLHAFETFINWSIFVFSFLRQTKHFSSPTHYKSSMTLTEEWKFTFVWRIHWEICSEPVAKSRKLVRPWMFERENVLNETL